MPVNKSKVSRAALACTALALLVSLAGCSSGGSSHGSAFFPADSACVSNPSSCIHKGRYESDERAYAEREAARLNQLALEQLRRSASK
ncbi:MAG: hypothetical protein GX049_11800 [Alcaligenaceae bacterium]|nr:hypothetical protein [Alcaligenaceae bacterium]